MNWKFYIIVNKNCSYAGVTPDLERRIKKHNGELSGGAKYTRSRGPNWSYVCTILSNPKRNSSIGRILAGFCRSSL